jgi:hypothetical protein
LAARGDFGPKTGPVGKCWILPATGLAPPAGAMEPPASAATPTDTIADFKRGKIAKSGGRDRD